MKLLFILLAIISLIHCESEDSRKREDKNPELTGDELDSEDADEIPESEEFPINSFKIAQNISNFKSVKKDSRVCDFKDDHLIGGMLFSGANLMAPEGSYKKIPTKLFINSPGMNWRDDFKYMPEYHLFENGTLENSVLILPFKYDQHDTYAKYSDWCSAEKDCIVYVIFKGEIFEPLYPEKHYLYSGKPLILIIFNDQLLDFSLCSKT